VDEEIAMTSSSRTRWIGFRCLGPQTEEFSPYTPDCLTIVANRWHEESKRRYEELAHQWLELAEQRQRCV
jgi:hypothetical protein